MTTTFRRNRPQDMPRLNEARRLYELILQGVTTGKGVTSVQDHGYMRRVRITDCPTVEVELGRTGLYFEEVGGGKVHVGVPSNRWESVPGYFERNSKPIIHELIHYLDWKRNRSGFAAAGKSYPQNDGNPHSVVKTHPREYYNHPSEMNAYFQQAVHVMTTPLEDAITEVDSDQINTHQAGAWRLHDWLAANANFDNFWWNFMTAVGGDAIENLTPSNLRRFKKRAWSVWRESMDRGQAAWQRLVDEGDPMVEFMEPNK